MSSEHGATIVDKEEIRDFIGRLSEVDHVLAAEVDDLFYRIEKYGIGRQSDTKFCVLCRSGVHTESSHQNNEVGPETPR